MSLQKSLTLTKPLIGLSSIVGQVREVSVLKQPVQVIMTKDTRRGRAGEHRFVRNPVAKRLQSVGKAVVIRSQGDLDKYYRQQPAEFFEEQDRKIELFHRKDRLIRGQINVWVKAPGAFGEIYFPLKEADVADLIKRQMKVQVEPEDVLMEKPIKTLGHWGVPVNVEGEQVLVRMNIRRRCW
eukprot:TRINITY_DN998_c0_g1_i1.p2 TRINITY_DN998_c0_g1~~TRINITY_DN998_c0_g1_i1.p2  ORF type:complete len:202 (-),score=95.48 TRINITY_DN998_c0_g1_i1:51-596(-)